MKARHKAMTEEMKIRLMESRDVEAVECLEKQCFSDPWSGKLLLEGLNSKWDTFWVAVLDDTVIGYSNLRVLSDEGELEPIAVGADHTRLGIGSRLMEAMEDFAAQNQVKAVTLEVRSQNTAALKLYKSYGFEEAGVRRRYYHDPEDDAVIMWQYRS